MNIRRFPLTALLALALLLAGCGLNPKLTNANLDRVHNGMTQEEVRSLLGKPDRIETGETLGIKGTTFYYSKKDAEVKIVFLNDGVMIKDGVFK